MTLTCDYLVIGAGAAGCVVARRLAEGGFSVILAEAGSADSDWRIHVPLLSMLTMGNETRNWNFDTEPVPALGARPVRLLAGKVIGGSSSINGLIYTRGHPAEFDRWREMGCIGWGFEDVLPYFRKSESSTRQESRWHGQSGPWPIRHAPSGLPVYRAFLDAAGQSGIPVEDDLGAGIEEGIGYYDLNVSAQGRRISSARAYLKNCPSNLSVRTGLTAMRVILDGARTTGAEFVDASGRRVTVSASSETIISAGAINSPKLLMLSGIGDAKRLKEVGIEPQFDRPSVGRNLQNHACYTMQYTCSRPVSLFRYLHPLRAAGALSDYVLNGGGPLAETPFAVGGSFRTDPASVVPEMHVTLFSALVQGHERSPWPFRMLGLTAPLPERHGFGVTLSQGVPFSRGEVLLSSADPMAAPKIYARYFDDPRDMAVLLAGVKKMRTVMKHPAIACHVRSELVPGDNLPDEELVESIRQYGGTFHHQSGTCAMVATDEAVVDPRLRVRGLEGLRVADASVMPLILNATPHASVIMIGEKAAAMMIEDRRERR